MSNVLEVAEWMGNPLGGIRSSWRPTRQLKGLVVRKTTATEPWVSSKGKSTNVKRAVSYSVGAILANRVSDIDQLDRVEISLPNLFDSKGVEVRKQAEGSNGNARPQLNTPLSWPCGLNDSLELYWFS